MVQPTTMNIDGEDNGPVFASELSQLIDAHTTDFAGPTPPVSPIANMIWQDTSVSPPIFRRRNETNSAWDTMGSWSNSVYSGSCLGSSGSTAVLSTPRTISVSGDATGASSGFNGSANVTIPLTLANSGAAAGTYGNGTNTLTVTVNSKGLITSIANTPITFPTVVSKFNGRTGDVTLTAADVFTVLPTKTGKAGRPLTLNSAETGVEWGSWLGGSWTLVLTTTSGGTYDLKTTYGKGLYKVKVTCGANYDVWNVLITDDPTGAADQYLQAYPPESLNYDNNLITVTSGVVLWPAGTLTTLQVWKL